MDNLNVIAFIPARSGSKSIVDKNIKLLGDKPLLAYSIQSAISAGIKRIIVNTDSAEYAKIAKEWGAEVMMRPSPLAKDNTSMFELLRSEIPKITPKPDLILLLQPTTPFRNKNHILLSISYLQSKFNEFDSLISVERVPEKYNPAVVIIETPTGKGMVMGKLKTWKEKIMAKFTGKTWTEPSLAGVPVSHRITQRQENPSAWVPTGSVYLFKAENLKAGSLYGGQVMLLETETQININSMKDWQKAEECLKINDK